MGNNPTGARGKTRMNLTGTRAKIQAAKLIARLQDHIFGRLKTPLDVSQVRAIDILLKKVVPDLTRTEVTADITHRYVVRLPDVLDKETWLKRFGDPRREIDGTLNGGGNGSLQ